MACPASAHSTDADFRSAPSRVIALTPYLRQYSGPLVVLWPVSYFLLLVSYCFDRLLWRQEWAAPEEE